MKCALLLLKHRLPVFHHSDDVIAILEAAFEDGEGERIKQVLLDRAVEGAGTEDGIEAGVGEVAGGVVGDGEVDVLLGEAVWPKGLNAALRNNANGVSVGVLDEPHFYRVPHLLRPD